MSRRKRVLIVQENFQPPGGGQGVSAWAVQALCGAYALDLLSWEPVSTDPINKFYGTCLRASDFGILGYPARLRALVDLDPDPYSFQPMAFLMRYAKVIHSHYDLVIGFTNETDYGVRGIQYIHYPYLSSGYRQLHAPGPLSARLRARLNFYLRPWRIISGFRFQSALKNHTLVNSDWTGERVRATYNIPTQTLYPPVAGNFAETPWAERENGFLALGRLDRLKNYEHIIAILHAVRARGHPIHLHLVVSKSAVHADGAYIAKIRTLAAQHSAWVHWHENIDRVALEQLVSAHRYGIHGMQFEHFGMGIAEMVRGGCTVFVPNSGGQIEIVGGDARMTYNSTEDAIEKITRVLENTALQIELQDLILDRARLYSAERFMREVRVIIAEQTQITAARGSSAT